MPTCSPLREAMSPKIIGLVVCWLIVAGFIIGTVLTGVYYYPQDQPSYSTGNCSVVCTFFEINACGCSRKREARQQRIRRFRLQCLQEQEFVQQEHPDRQTLVVVPRFIVTRSLMIFICWELRMPTTIPTPINVGANHTSVSVLISLLRWWSIRRHVIMILLMLIIHYRLINPKDPLEDCCC